MFSKENVKNMAIPENKKELIAHVAIKVLHSRFQSFPEEDQNNRNAPFHVAFMRAFQPQLEGRVSSISDIVSLSSWMHGLSTSLGQSFFEPVAHILCDGQKRQFNSKHLYTNQATAIAEIMTDLKNGDKQPSVRREDSILEYTANGEKQNAPNFTVDCFYETDTDVVAIEMKSVRPNSGEMRSEKQKLLTGKAVLRELYPDKNVNYIFGFPFDPTAMSDVNYDKQRFLQYLIEAEKFLAHDDFLIADELWSFLAGSEGAMQEILDIINSISTPEFMDKFEMIQDINTNENDKREIFEEWHMYSEIDILDNVTRTSRNSRIYNQSIFRTDGSYNNNRLRLLEKIN